MKIIKIIFYLIYKSFPSFFCEKDIVPKKFFLWERFYFLWFMVFIINPKNHFFKFKSSLINIVFT